MTENSNILRAIGRAIARALCAIAMTGLPYVSQASAQAPVPDTANARVIIKYKTTSPVLKAGVPAEQKPAEQAKAMSARTGLALRAGAAVDDRSHVLFSEGMTSAELAARLAVESDVEYAVPDERRHPLSAPNDPL